MDSRLIRCWRLAGLLTVVFLIVTLRPACAMHLAEGILPIPWALAWFAVAAPFFLVALAGLRRRERTDLFYKPFLAMVASAVFVLSCMPIPVPTAGTCSHPCGTGLSAILVGPWMTTLVTTVVLLIQALLLAHGGISTLGADLVSMGIAGGFSGYLVFCTARRLGASLFVAGFLAGLLADWATYATTSLELALALHGDMNTSKLFVTVLIAFIPTQLPLGILEGFLTGGALAFLEKRRPDILSRMGVTAK